MLAMVRGGDGGDFMAIEMVMAIRGGVCISGGIGGGETRGLLYVSYVWW